MTQPKKTKKVEPKRRRRQNDSVADWASAEPGNIIAVICAVAQNDGAVRFGYSRDGGAYSVGIYGDGKPFTEFCPATGNVDEWLEGIAFDYG
jgi:hypothetical protein